MQEILIIRNNDIPSLFNVVQVNFETEDAKTIESMLTFEQAVELKETLSEAEVA